MYQLVDGQQRTAAELRHVGDQRNVDGIRQPGEFVGRFQGFGEDEVGTGLGIGQTAFDGRLQPFHRTRITAGDDHELRIPPGADRSPKFGDHLLRADEALARQMPAPFGHLLVFQMQAGQTGRLEQPHGAFDRRPFAEPGVGIGEDGDLDRLCQIAGLLGELGGGQQSDVRQSGQPRRQGRPRLVSRSKARPFGHPRHQRIEDARDHQRRLLQLAAEAGSRRMRDVGSAHGMSPVSARWPSHDRRQLPRGPLSLWHSCGGSDSPGSNDCTPGHCPAMGG